MDRRVKTAAKTAVIGVIFVAIALVLFRNFDQVREASARGDLRFDWRDLLLSYGFLFAYFLSRSLLWHFLTVRNACAVDVRKAVVCWLVSILGKYIPGKVFLLAGRVYLYQKYGASKTRVALCFLIEGTAALVSSALLLLLGLLFLDLPIAGQVRPLAPAILVGLVVVLVVLHPRVLERALGVLLKLFRREPVPVTLRYGDILVAVGIAGFNWLLLGAGFFFLINALVTLGWGVLPYITGAFSFAAVIGVLALFAPSGLGVREGILLILLQPLLGPGLATVVVLISRAWMTLGELLAVGLALAADRLWLGEIGVRNREAVRPTAAE